MEGYNFTFMIAHNIWEIEKQIVSRDEQIIGITSGVFDLLHPLHVMYLQRCASQCSDLFVLVDSDDFTLTNKKRMPIFNEQDRCFMLDSLECVKGVMIMRELEDLKRTMQRLAASYKTKFFRNHSSVYGEKTITVENVELIIVPDVQRLSSTTEIINYLKS